MRYFIPPHVRSVSHDGGVVLLDLRRGTYFTLNPVGTRVWAEITAHCTRDAAIDALGRAFPVARERLERDVDTLLERLEKADLLARGAASARVGGAVGTPARPDVPRSPAAYAPKARFGAARHVVWSLRAYLALIAADARIRLTGFGRFHEHVRGCPVRASGDVDPADAARISAAVDEAAAYYFKHAWCLQRSAAACLLLRRRGFAARLCIGARRMPFEAHAWVEIDGRVVNDLPRAQTEYELIEQC